ncbi:hypothetical protein Tco_0025246 [Tanacetum coccineum]
MSTSSLMVEKTVHNVAYTDLRHKAKCRVLILARTNLSQHNFTTCSRLHNFTTSSQLQDFFTTLLISQLSSTTWILERICGLFWAERMSAKGEKIVGKSPVFIGQTGGALSFVYGGPPPSTLSPWSSSLPHISSPPLPISSPPLPLPPPTVDSPTYAEAPLCYRAAGIRLRASLLSTYHPLHPSPPLPPLPLSLHVPPHVPTSLPLPSSPLPPLPALLFIPPPIDCMEDIPKAELPPHKRLCLTALTLRYEVGESLTAAPRPIGDVWVDPREAVEELALTTLEGVNARVTKIAAVQEQDTHDIYTVIEDTQNRQTQLSSTVHYELQAYRAHIQMQDYRIASQESLMTILIAHVSSLQG